MENIHKSREIIKKWYKKLSFSKKFDNEFEQALETFVMPDASEIDNYIIKDENRIENLLAYLYFCENLEKKYKEKNIPEKILLDTLSDIVIWSDISYDITGKFGLCEASWLKTHLSFRLFRLGRLQFAFGKCEADIDAVGAKKGDKTVEVHIPEGGGLEPELCNQSYEYAEKFFAEFFPEYDYKCFTCHSWLLDETLKKHMREGANILKFQGLYKTIFTEESFAILRYTFSRDMTVDKLAEAEPKSSFAQKIKEHILNGGKFYQTYGYIKLPV